jgi:hypothetical protein
MVEREAEGSARQAPRQKPPLFRRNVLIVEREAKRSVTRP